MKPAKKIQMQKMPAAVSANATPGWKGGFDHALKNIGKFLCILVFVLCLVQPDTVYADTCNMESTGISYKITANGEYTNWEGASNVSQFTDNKGNFCFSYYSGKTVTIVKTSNGKVSGKKITLKMPYPIFGGVTCDSKGYYYVVSGRKNTTKNFSKKTVFITKYSKSGKRIKTVGDNGSSSIPGYGSRFRTKTPFQAGNCSIAVNGNYLAVHYARGMYNGHQSNSAFIINTQNMKKMKTGTIYSSHSFAQRVVPYKKGFMFVSEGDAYDRAFTISTIPNMSTGKVTNQNCFDFWVQQGASNNMTVVNNNFARLGDLVMLGTNKAALVATSAPSLDQNAVSETAQIFIQIFNPSKNLRKASAYTTTGTRSGLSGLNGKKKVKNYGVQWLTSLSSKCTIEHPQAVTDGKGNTIVFYELKQRMNEWNYYYGVRYFVVDKNGNRSDIKLFSYSACMNPCRTPIYKDGTVYWIGNKAGDSKHTVYLYSLKIDGQ